MIIISLLIDSGNNIYYYKDFRDFIQKKLFEITGPQLLRRGKFVNVAAYEKENCVLTGATDPL